jgi:hypothetical protein
MVLKYQYLPLLLEEFCAAGYKEVRMWDEMYSDWLCVPESIKKTSLKPSGSVSLLTGSTPGIHYPEAEYYWRRVRLAADSDFVHVLKSAGYEVEPAVTDNKTVVIKFGVHCPGVRSERDVSIWEQIANVADYQRYWADNQVSVTVKFKSSETQDIKHALECFENQLKGISFLPIEDHGYAQPPYEKATKEEVEAYVSSLKPLDFHAVVETADAEKFCDGQYCTT